MKNTRENVAKHREGERLPTQVQTYRTLFFKQMNLSLHKMIKQTLHISNGFFPSLCCSARIANKVFYIHLQLWLKMHECSELTEKDLIPQ